LRKGKIPRQARDDGNIVIPSLARDLSFRVYDALVAPIAPSVPLKIDQIGPDLRQQAHQLVALGLR
jgi:hypothetical protein